MPAHPTTWLRDFLEARELTSPDGRPLYAYRCNNREFHSLTETLSSHRPLAGVSDATTRAFVVYAAEWWQRRYDGRQWAWEPLLASIRWLSVHYAELYAPIRQALTWWRVELVRLPGSVRYLGTFACHGGLPLALIGNDNHRIVHYLRAVLKHTAMYRQFVDDPIELARDQQRLLLPPTLRREYVFRLAADLVNAVLDLESEVKGDDPLIALDAARPDWRDRMPLDLENERARGLLTGLLREAKRGPAGTVAIFRLERFLRETGTGSRLGARILLPAAIPADSLARLVGVRASTLPHRLQVVLDGNRVHNAGVYAAQSDEFLLLRGPQFSFTEIWDWEAASEVRLLFRSGGVVGESVVPYQGSALGELPWVFRTDTHERVFLGEGSVSNRAPEVFALVPDACEVEDADAVDVTSEIILNRALWKISGRTAVDTPLGRCVIRPSSGQQPEEQEYRLSGQRFYGAESAWPVFRNVPVLRVSRAGQPKRSVPANQVAWRQTGGEWRQCPEADVFGLWEIRHVRDGELRYFGRVGIIPSQFDLVLEPGAQISEGDILLRGADAVKVAVTNVDVDWSHRIDGEAVHVHVVAGNQEAVPANVQLRLHWPDSQALDLRVPFPGHGARFLRDGEAVHGPRIAVDDLYGMRASAISPNDVQRFWIEGELKAPDLDDLQRVAHFRRLLRRQGVAQELALIELRPLIERMLAGSSSAEAVVQLRVVSSGGRENAIAEVSRFAGNLEYDASTSVVSTFLEAGEGDVTTVSCEALPLAKPGDEPIPLSLVRSGDGYVGALMHQELDMAESWLVVARHDDRMLAHPIVLGGTSSDDSVIEDAHTPPLREAFCIADSKLRKSSIAAAMDAILASEDTDYRVDEEWAFLNDALLRAADIPMTAFDLLKVLAKKPRLLIRCLFRLENTHRQLLWRFDKELPFSWSLVERDTWWIEAMWAFEQMRDQLAQVVDGDHEGMASRHVCAVLDEGAERLPALNTVATDVALRLGGGAVSQRLVQEAQRSRNEQTPALVTSLAGADDWPKGYGRREWAQELGLNLESLSIWQHADEPWVRQPIFDTPVVAALCCIFADAKPTPRTTFLVKQMRAHEPDWFDLAYQAAWYRFAHAKDNS